MGWSSLLSSSTHDQLYLTLMFSFRLKLSMFSRPYFKEVLGIVFALLTISLYDGMCIVRCHFLFQARFWGIYPRIVEFLLNIALILHGLHILWLFKDISLMHCRETLADILSLFRPLIARYLLPVQYFPFWSSLASKCQDHQEDISEGWFLIRKLLSEIKRYICNLIKHNYTTFLSGQKVVLKSR